MTPESPPPAPSAPLAPLYPPSPKDGAVAIETSTAYRVRVVLVLLSLLLFLAIYLGLAVASGWLVLWALSGPTAGRKSSYGFLDFLLTIGAAMLFAFFVKGLFKRSKRDIDKLVQVTEKEQPELFAFVRKLCKDAGAPLPRAIFLTHEVNAAVFYPRSLLSLLVPVRKNLLIGVGLVNLLNISELKAVLAHEFGHFAQSSMKLGQYVYIANQAIRDMAFARDSWDGWLAKWRAIDLRISFPAWIITGVVYVLRFLLKQIFRVVNIANLSLSRQMEFNADLNAVRLTGSDALISGLWKTERGSLAMQRAFTLLHSMSEHGKYTDDLFFHQESELSRLDGLLDKQEERTAFIRSLREPYSYGQTVHFQEGEGQATSMWASHPPNRDREINAKKRYVELEPVTTSAWKLLSGRKGLKKRLTLLAYDELLGSKVSPKNCLPAEEIQKLAREDEDEREQAPHYHGLYENRIVELGDIDKLILSLDAEGAPAPNELRNKASAWTGAKLASFMTKYNRIVTTIDILASYINAHAQGNAPKTFEHDGKKISIKEAKPLYDAANEEAEKLRKRLKTADRTLFRHFYTRAKASPETRDDLVRRYRFLLAVQGVILKLKEKESMSLAVVRQLQQNKELNDETFRSYVAALASCYEELSRTLVASKKIRMPRLTHLEEGALVSSFILPDGVIEPMPDPTKIEGPWLMSLLRQIGQALGRLRRLHFKNLGVLLKLQEDLDPDLYAPASGSKMGTDVLNSEDDGRSAS